MQTQNVVSWEHPLKNAPADFMDELDQIDPLICSREDLERLKQLAPTERIAAYLDGLLDNRTVNAIVTEKDF